MKNKQWCLENYENNAVYCDSYTGQGAKDSIPLPFKPHGFSVQLSPVGGTALIEASNNGIKWVPWEIGAVDKSSIEALIPVRFIRATLVTATSCDISIWGF